MHGKNWDVLDNTVRASVVCGCHVGPLPVQILRVVDMSNNAQS